MNLVKILLGLTMKKLNVTKIYSSKEKLLITVHTIKFHLKKLKKVIF